MGFVYKIMKVYVFDPNKVLETLMNILRNKIVERVFGSVNDHASGSVSNVLFCTLWSTSCNM